MAAVAAERDPALFSAGYSANRDIEAAEKLFPRDLKPCAVVSVGFKYDVDDLGRENLAAKKSAIERIPHILQHAADPLGFPVNELRPEGICPTVYDDRGLIFRELALQTSTSDVSV